MYDLLVWYGWIYFQPQPLLVRTHISPQFRVERSWMAQSETGQHCVRFVALYSRLSYELLISLVTWHSSSPSLKDYCWNKQQIGKSSNSPIAVRDNWSSRALQLIYMRSAEPQMQCQNRKTSPSKTFKVTTRVIDPFSVVNRVVPLIEIILQLGNILGRCLRSRTIVRGRNHPIAAGHSGRQACKQMHRECAQGRGPQIQPGTTFMAGSRIGRISYIRNIARMPRNNEKTTRSSRHHCRKRQG